jgi:hypothetical protein
VSAPVHELRSLDDILAVIRQRPECVDDLAMQVRMWMLGQVAPNLPHLPWRPDPSVILYRPGSSGLPLAVSAAIGTSAADDL